MINWSIILSICVFAILDTIALYNTYVHAYNNTIIWELFAFKYFNGSRQPWKLNTFATYIIRQQKITVWLYSREAAVSVDEEVF